MRVTLQMVGARIAVLSLLCLVVLATATPALNSTDSTAVFHWPRLFRGGQTAVLNGSEQSNASGSSAEPGDESFGTPLARLCAALRSRLEYTGRAAAQGLRSATQHAERLLRSAPQHAQRLLRSGTEHAQRLLASLLRALQRTARSLRDAAVATVRRWGVALRRSVRSALDALAAASRRRADALVAAARRRRDALFSSPRRLREAASRWWRRDRAVSHVLRHSRAGRWYSVLRCRRGATKRQLREAYRGRAKRTHPDKTIDDRANAAFDALRDAYELLADDGRRAAYDRQLEAQDRQERETRRRRRAATRRSILIGLRRFGTACVRLF